MRRNPIYVFEDLQSIGIYNVPVGSTVQINDADDLTPGSQPLLVQVVSKNGLSTGSTVAEFLSNSDNYSNASDSTEIPSELEKIEQNGKIGWRILGADNTKYGEIGLKAIDLTQVNTGASGVASFGATGDYAFTAGFETQASGEKSTALGRGTKTQTLGKTVIGSYNTDLNNTALVEFGIGQADSERKDGLVLYADGSVEAPNSTMTAIDNRGQYALITKEYLDTIDAKKVNRSGDHMVGDLFIDGASLFVRKDNNIGGDISLDGSLTVGNGSNGYSYVYFNAGNANIVYNTVSNEFQLEGPSTSGAQRIWHSGNMGTQSGLDADLLDGLQPNELPISDATSAELDLKYDKAGGTISGSVAIEGELGVTSTARFGGNVELGTVTTEVTFINDITINGGLTVGQYISGLALELGLDQNQSKIIFTDTASADPAFYWDANNGYKDFFVDTDVSVGNVVWHAGNFLPNDKYDKTGGPISGDVSVSGNIDVTQNINADGDLTIGGTAIISGDLRGNANLNILNNITSDTLNTTTASVDGEFNLGGSAHVSGTGIFGSGLNITGDSSFANNLNVDGISTFNNDVVITGNLDIDKYLRVVGDAYFDKTVSIGYDADNNSTIYFTDISGRVPALYWDKDTADFFVNIDTATTTGTKIWHAGNLDPNDETIFPKHFDTLADTPASKTNAAGKYLRVSTDETKIEYVDVPDNSALWGNITGDINNQTDLIDKLNLKFDKSGGTISGTLQVDGTSVFNDLVTFNKKLTARDIAEFEQSVTFDLDITVQGESTFNEDSTFGAKVNILGDIDVSADSYFRGDTWITGDLGVQGSSTLQGNVAVQNDLLVQNNLNVMLSTQLTGSTSIGSTLTVSDETTLNDKLSANGDVDIQGLTRIYNDIQIQGDIYGYSDASLTGDLRVSGTSSLTGDVVAGANVTVTDNLTVNKQTNLIEAAHLQDTLDVAGTTSLVGDVSMSNSLTVGTTLDIGTNTTIGGDLTVNGASTLTGNVSLANNLSVGGDLDVTGISTFGDNINITGSGSFTGDIIVAGTSTLTGLVTANDNVVIDKNLNVKTDTDIDGLLNVDSDATFGNNIDVNSNVYVHQNLIVDYNSTVDGLTVGRGAASFEDTLTVSGLITANDGLQVNGDTTLNGKLDVSFDTTIGGNLSVTGDITENGDRVATLDSSTGKLKTSQLPALAITSVYVKNTISERDQLVTDGVVEEGDVCKVIDSDGNGNPQTYILDSTDTWIDIQETSNVISVNGQTGAVVLSTDDIAEGTTNLYYTDARADARVQAAIDDNAWTGDTDKILSADKISTEFTGIDNRVSTNEVDISNLSNEVDATQAGAGLGSDGSYTADSTTNYISGATDLFNADTLLDSAIKTNSDNITTNSNDISTLQTDKLDKTGGLVTGDLNIDNEYHLLVNPWTSGGNVSAQILGDRFEFIDGDNNITAGIIYDITNKHVDIKVNDITSISLVENEAPSTQFQPTATNHLTRKDYVDSEIASIPTRHTQDEDGDGTTVEYTISGIILTNSDIDVFIDGVMQRPDGSIYTVSDNGTDTKVSFNTAPANGAWIRFNYYN